MVKVYQSATTCSFNNGGYPKPQNKICLSINLEVCLSKERIFLLLKEDHGSADIAMNIFNYYSK